MTNDLKKDASEGAETSDLDKNAIDDVSNVPTISYIKKLQLDEEISANDRDSFSTVQIERRPHSAWTNEFTPDDVTTNEDVAVLVQDTLREIYSYINAASPRMEIATSRTHCRLRKEDLESSKWSIKDVRDHFVY